MCIAIKELTATMRNLHQIPTEAEKIAMRIALRRLELEETKAAREFSIDTSDNMTGVIEIPVRLPEATE